MFKSIMKSAALAAAICLAVAACGGNAQAADVSFKASDGQVFGAQNAYKYEMYVSGGYVKIVYLNGQDSLAVDGGNLAGRILQALPGLIQITGTNSYLDPSYVARAVCQSGVSKAAIYNSGLIIEVADNCAMVQQFQAKAK